MNRLQKPEKKHSGNSTATVFCLIWLMLSIVLILISISCSKDDETKPQSAKAKLGIVVNLDMKITERFIESKSTCSTADFKINIFKSSGEMVYSCDKASELPAEIELDPGEYYVTAQSDNSAIASFNNPCFSGQSEITVLNANEFKTIHVNCTLSNCAVSIIYSDYVKTNYSGYFTEVSAGTDKLIFVKDETRLGYFDIQPITIETTLTYTLPNGSEYQKELAGTIAHPEKGRLYEIEIDASITQGYSVLNINLDESLEKQTILINDTTSTILKYGDLLITEIMYDPVSLPDADGEWFEIYNNSVKNISLLNLVINNSTASHIISSDITMAPGDYVVLAKKDTAVNMPKYIYGSAISLTNTSGTVSLSTYGTSGSDGRIIASVTYDTSFPKASGATLSLNPLYLDAEMAKSGSSWCLGNTAYHTGDLGTPGLPNNICE